LNPNVFNPTDLDAENWMEASAALGMREIIITAHHEGGFALWPSKFTPYSVAASSWKGGKGDVLREFADAANKWGIKISYYLNVQDDGYMTSVAKYNSSEFVRRQVGMVTEVLTEYGPVNRFWFDGTSDFTGNKTALWDTIYETIRTVSPATMITSYRGDVCSAQEGKTLYTNSGTVRVFRQQFTLEDAIGSHACSLEANTRVTNGIPLGFLLFLPVHIVKCVQTLKVRRQIRPTLQVVNLQQVRPPFAPFYFRASREGAILLGSNHILSAHQLAEALML
jgi:hypothetical protein